jgi:serine/threonine protein kinase
MLEWFRSLTYLTSLGNGGFATVYKAQDRDGDYFAVKSILKTSGQEENIAREVSAGLMLQHQNLVSFVSNFEDRENHLLVFEHIPGTALHFATLTIGANLFEYMEARNFEAFSEIQAYSLFRQMVDAVEYCHSQGVVHFDVKVFPHQELV